MTAGRCLTTLGAAQAGCGKERVATELIARADEVAEVLAAVRHGAGAVVSGDPGVGKTALARAVAARVADSGDSVGRVVATAAGQDMPFGALAPLLPDDVTPMHPALVLGALARNLRQRGGSQLPLVVVDDAHLLDDQSAATLLGLVASGAGRVLATVRSGVPAPDAVRSLWKDEFVAGVAIGPFDPDATHEFLVSYLGGEVAAATVALLWEQTQGNALYLSEVVRASRANGHLVDEGGVWFWRGEREVPPRLADLLDRRFDDLSEAGLDALGLLVLAEPVTLETLEGAVSRDAIGQLESHGLVEVTRRGGQVRYGFAHPMLGAAAERRLSPIRRRRLADALIHAPGATADLVRRATWQLDATGPPDVDLLVAGAQATLLTRPALAEQMAERALPHDPGPQAALTLADAHAEQGNVAAARAAQAVAVTRARTDDERLAAKLNEISLTAFSDRRPDLALDAIAAARAELPESHHLDLDSVAALMTVFSARPAEALSLADRVLASSPSRPAVIRATCARVVALTMVDRLPEALRTADEVVAYVAAGPASPYAQAMAQLASGVASHVAFDMDRAPSTDPLSGRLGDRGVPGRFRAPRGAGDPPLVPGRAPAHAGPSRAGADLAARGARPAEGGRRTAAFRGVRTAGGQPSQPRARARPRRDCPR